MPAAAADARAAAGHGRRNTRSGRRATCKDKDKKADKKRQQAKSPQSLKVAAATLALAATAPVPTTLFAWHPALAALSLPLAAAAGVVVAGRAAAAKRASGADRRATLERRVKLHFLLSAAASWCLVLSTAAVFLSKAQARRPHLVSAHARAGAAALVAWFGALLAAELKVWRDGPPWRAAPRFLWSDQSHRRLGVGALLVLGGAAATGLALTGFGNAARGAAAADGARGRVRWFCSRGLRPAPRLREGPRAAPPAARRARGGGRRRPSRRRVAPREDRRRALPFSRRAIVSLACLRDFASRAASAAMASICARPV